ncbi:MAG: ATP-binding cassette domain-containing protein [Desulfitobacteriaceae bacterium]|nr:ATP-binding cassette domain-containing protein [Desulfitobacteriaceae bacterium]MDI6881076.1 ATP-binding cassette domain-containing protein [Desulfitobacteriaceae bacterium]MDI6915162.1 ATP-binding cassette domain-containing protein [Desulfitobacteriaceae bacterium]
MFQFNLTYAPGGKEVIQAAADVVEGEVLVVSAPSGTGKTTLLRILARLQPALSGQVFLYGEDWLGIPASHWRALVHYLAQKPALFEGSVADNLAKPFAIRVLSEKPFLANKAKALMAELRLPSHLWEQDARTLSGGEAARLALVRALLIEPALMLLDEPTAALDEASRQAFYAVLQSWLRQPGHAALLVSHAEDYQLNNLKILNLRSLP